MKNRPRRIPSNEIDYRAYDIIVSLWGKQLSRETRLEERYWLALEIVDEILPTYQNSLPESEMENHQREDFVECLDDACEKIIRGYQPGIKKLFDFSQIFPNS